MEQKAITVEMILKDAVESLNSIIIPVSLVDSVGSPVKRVAVNLQVCLDALARKAEESEAQNDDQKEGIQNDRAE